MRLERLIPAILYAIIFTLFLTILKKSSKKEKDIRDICIGFTLGCIGSAIFIP